MNDPDAARKAEAAAVARAAAETYPRARVKPMTERVAELMGRLRVPADRAVGARVGRPRG